MKGVQRYTVTKLEDPHGPIYRLDGPGLQLQRTYRGDEFRQRMHDMAELMNFAFEQGRRVLDSNRQSKPTDRQPAVSAGETQNPQV